jgi:hypothetical protein
VRPALILATEIGLSSRVSAAGAVRIHALAVHRCVARAAVCHLIAAAHGRVNKVARGRPRLAGGRGIRRAAQLAVGVSAILDRAAGASQDAPANLRTHDISARPLSLGTRALVAAPRFLAIGTLAAASARGPAALASTSRARAAAHASAAHACGSAAPRARVAADSTTRHASAASCRGGSCIASAAAAAD